MPDFTLRQIEYLVASIDRGSIAAASEQLGVTQPSVSVAITKLEEQFGVQLLLRHPSQGVTATAAAARLLVSARGLLAHAEDLQREAMSSGDSVVGNVKLGSFSTLAPMMLPALIQALQNDYAGIKLQLHEGNQSFLLDGLYAGRLEMAMLYDLDLPSDIRTVQVVELPVYVALPPDHPKARQSSVKLAELASDPLILLDVPPSRDYFLGLFDAVGLTPNVAIRSPSLELVRGMVGRGLGYSLLVTRPEGDRTYDGSSLAIRPLKGKHRTSRVVLASLAGLRPTRLMTCIEQVALSVSREWLARGSML